MEFEHVDVTAIVGILAGTSVVGLPVLGLTLRFALKPLLDSYARAFPSALRSQAEFDRLERRVKELEETLAQTALPPGPPRGDRMVSARSELELPRS
jgi:hypothetical protein